MSKHKPTPSSSKSRGLRRAVAGVFAILALSLAAPSQAQTVTATLTPNRPNIGNGQPFTLTLSITTNFVSSGLTFFLQSSNNASGLFRIVSRDMSMSPYSDPTTSDATAIGGDAGLLNPVNDFDLGATTDGFNNAPPGTYTIATLTFAGVNLAPGVYNIFTDRGVVSQAIGGGFVDRPFTASASFVVPEPMTISFVVAGGLLLAAVARRRGSERGLA